MPSATAKSNPEPAWPSTIHRLLRAADVRQVAYVPDGGHAALIRLARADPEMAAVPLTTEEEGVAMLAGAWLGGQRGVLLMQSSGVGNCTNMLSLVRICRFPLFALIAMRGEWGEFNPWQVPMGSTTREVFELMDTRVVRVEREEDVEPTIQAASDTAFRGGTATAVLLAQRLIGAKDFAK